MVKNRIPKDKEILTNEETEFVIENSPDDTPMNHDGDEKTLVATDSPDDPTIWERMAHSGTFKK